MKYNKEAVIELIEKRLGRIREAEAVRAEGYADRYKREIEQRNKAFGGARERLERVKDVLSTTYLSEAELLRAFSDAIDRPIAKEPELGSEENKLSERIEEVLEVFKTGAPPEVTTADLRAFGLTEYVKASR